jgi:hypothetical protein
MNMEAKITRRENWRYTSARGQSDRARCEGYFKSRWEVLGGGDVVVFDGGELRGANQLVWAKRVYIPHLPSLACLLLLERFSAQAR